MNRRDFIRLMGGAAALAVVPSSTWVQDACQKMVVGFDPAYPTGGFYVVRYWFRNPLTGLFALAEEEISYDGKLLASHVDGVAAEVSRKHFASYQSLELIKEYEENKP